jgi:hypothetical protein
MSLPGRYSWTQTLGEVTLLVSVPAALRAKDVTVEIARNRIKVGLRGAAPILDAQLHKRVKPDDCSWTLEAADSAASAAAAAAAGAGAGAGAGVGAAAAAGGRTLMISLQKDNAMEWWSCVAAGEPEIDVAKVEPENSKLGDLDGDTRQVVEKMM